MYPPSLALVDDDLTFSSALAQHLRGLGIQVTAYGDADAWLRDANAFAHEFFVVGLNSLPGSHGIDLIKQLRQRSEAVLVVVSGHRSTQVFQDLVLAGADMHMDKPVCLEKLAVVIFALQRRAGQRVTTPQPWTLDRPTGALVAPDGARVALSDIDRCLLECFVGNDGQAMSRTALAKRLDRQGEFGATSLNAVIYRLRRRIERATPLPLPLHSKSRVGYVFKAPLRAL
jgi:two-component system, OmpR family, response regulator